MATRCPEHIAIQGAELQSIPIPNYAEFQVPKVAVAKTGSIPGNFNVPRSIMIEPQSGNFYVADSGNKRIQIFSNTGEYINKFGEEHLTNPWGILFHQDSIYITDICHNAILQFKLKDFTLVKKVGQKGDGKKEFDGPRQPAISHKHLIYVPDEYNERIQILTPDLDFHAELRNNDMSSPADIIFRNDKMFVLSCDDLTCIYVFDLKGEFIRCFITMGEGMQITRGMFFCMDGHNNFIITDWLEDDIKVISPEGQLLHTIGKYGYKPGTYSYPAGIVIQNNTNLICVSENRHFGLQIYVS
ncbi:PEP-CTERM domain protein [Oopsacas minuta]|uniref:PEP-CTERM domain protein n=1 Tax=Oopsacas minuta TaxID=111878 RepID=A0AAV7JNX9_9METZ|nr:PEP-CTERM domain protein [Oopsacas minuta]